MRRRVFLSGATLLSGSLPPGRTYAQGALTPEQRVLQLSLATGLSSLPLAPLVVERVAAVAQDASMFTQSKLRQNVANIGNQLRAAPALWQQTQVLLSPFSRELGLPDAVSAAIRNGLLIETPTGLRELGVDIVGGAQLGQAAATVLNRTLRNSGLLAPQRVYDTVLSALGPDAATLRKGIAGLLPPGLGQAQRDIEEIWNGLGSSSSGTKKLVEGYLSRAQAQGTAKLAEVAGKTRQALALADRQARQAILVPMQDAVRQFQAGASTFHALGSLLGQVDPRLGEMANKAARYLHSASQVAQAFNLLIAASTGTGTITALTGLLNGASGLGLSGAGDDAVAKARHEELLREMQQLRELMVKEFARLNLKVDHVIAQLDAVLLRLDRIDSRLLEVKETVRLTNVKLDLLAVRSSQAVIVASLQTTEVLLGSCRTLGVDGGRTVRDIMECRGKYDAVVKRLASGGWGLPAQIGASNFNVLMSQFSLARDATASFQPVGVGELWQGAGPLSGALQYIGVDNPIGTATYEPLLLQIMEEYADLKTRDPNGFSRLEPTDVARSVATLKAVADRHFLYLERLRAMPVVKAREHPTLGPLLSKYAEACRSFASRLIQDEAKRRVDKLEVEATGKDLYLVDASQPTGPGLNVVPAAYFAKDKLSPLFVNCATTCSKGEDTAPLLVVVSHTLAVEPSLPGVGVTHQYRLTMQIELRYGATVVSAFPYVMVFHVLASPAEVSANFAKLPVQALRAENAHRIAWLEGALQVGLQGLGWPKGAGWESFPGVLANLNLQERVRRIRVAAVTEELRSRLMSGQVLESKSAGVPQTGASGAPSPQRPGTMPALDALGKEAPLEVILERLDQLTVTLRAVCAYAFGESADNSDKLQGLLYGFPDNRLADKEIAQYWTVGGAGAQMAAKQGHPWHEPVGRMLKFPIELEEALDQMLPIAAKQGIGFRREYVRQTFNQTFASTLGAR